MALSIRIPNLLRALFCALLFAFPVVTGGNTLSAAVSDDVTTAVDTVQTKMDPGDSKMAPVMTESTKALKWVIFLLWVAVPLILFGSLIAYGVIKAKDNQTDAAKSTFIAVGIGVVFYYGVLAIFYA